MKTVVMNVISARMTITGMRTFTRSEIKETEMAMKTFRKVSMGIISQWISSRDKLRYFKEAWDFQEDNIKASITVRILVTLSLNMKMMMHRCSVTMVTIENEGQCLDRIIEWMKAGYRNPTWETLHSKYKSNWPNKADSSIWNSGKIFLRRISRYILREHLTLMKTKMVILISLRIRLRKLNFPSFCLVVVPFPFLILLKSRFPDPGQTAQRVRSYDSNSLDLQWQCS